MADFSEMTVLQRCAVTVSNVGLFKRDLAAEPDYFSES